MVSCTYVCSLLAFNLGYLNRPLANIFVGLLSVTCGAWQGLICLLHPRPTWWQSAYVLSLPCSPLVFPDLFLVSHWRCVCSAHSWTALVTQSRDVNSRNPRPIIGFKWHFGSPPWNPFILDAGLLDRQWGAALLMAADRVGVGECSSDHRNRAAWMPHTYIWTLKLPARHRLKSPLCSHRKKSLHNLYPVLPHRCH